MKRLVWLSSLIVLLFTTPLMATDYCSHADVKFCAPAENDGATLLDDISSSNNDGAFVSSGHPSWQSATPSPPDTYYNYYVEFNAASPDKITVTDHASLDVQQLTAVGWLYRTGGGAYGHIFSKWTGYAVTLDTGRPNAVKFITWIGSSSNDYFSANSAFSNDVWFHVACTFDGTNKKIYIDGVQSGSTGSHSGNLDAVGNNLIIGQYEGGGADYTFGGDMDELAIFGNDLDSTAINDIMNNGLEGSGAPAARRRMILFN